MRMTQHIDNALLLSELLQLPDQEGDPPRFSWDIQDIQDIEDIEDITGVDQSSYILR